MFRLGAVQYCRKENDIRRISRLEQGIAALERSKAQVESTYGSLK